MLWTEWERSGLRFRQEVFAHVPGGGEIHLTSGMDGDEVVIEVRDNGQGMDDTVKARIFDPFFTTKSGAKGTGLGLSVSFGIIEDHQGSIRAMSPVPPGIFDGKAASDEVKRPGTIFIVDLPLDHSYTSEEESVR